MSESLCKLTNEEFAGKFHSNEFTSPWSLADFLSVQTPFIRFQYKTITVCSFSNDAIILQILVVSVTISHFLC